MVGIKKTSLFFLLILILFCSINNYIWIEQFSFLPLRPDESDHLIQSLKFYKILKTHSLIGLKQPYFSRAYPPLFTFSAAILNLVFGTSKIVSTMTNSIYLIILIFSIYFLGKKIADKNVGLLSAFIVAMYPLIFGMQRWFMLDFALCTMVAFSIACLVYTENFTNRKFSLLFGLSLGLGMLTKWTFFVFLIGPFLYVVSRSLKESKSSIFNITSAIIIGFLISLTSLIHFNPSLGFLEGWISGANTGYIPITLNQTNWRTFAGATFYLRSLLWQISPFFSLIFLIVFIPHLKSNIKYKPLLLSWLLISLIVFMFIPNKWARYIMPVLPAIAIISAVGLLQLKWRRLKIGIISSIIAVGLIQYLLIFYNRNIKYNHHTFMWSYLHPPKTEIELSKIINHLISDYILSHIDSSGKRLSIGVIDTVPLMMEVNALRYSVIQKDLNCNLVSFPQEIEDFLRVKDKLSFLITVRSNSTPWPTKQEIEQMFKIERMDKIMNIDDADYKTYEQVFEKLSKVFRVIKIIEASLNGMYGKMYFFILEKQMI